MNEIQRLQQLAGIITEIKVNKPGILQFNYEEEDDDGQWKIIYLGKDGEVWQGHEDYAGDPGFLKMEFDVENGDEDEQDRMDSLISLLNKYNIDYDVTEEDDINYVRIPKDKLDLR